MLMRVSALRCERECRYDVTSDTWTVMGGLSTARSALASVVLNGKIYAVGGWDGEHYLNSVERFDQQVLLIAWLY